MMKLDKKQADGCSPKITVVLSPPMLELLRNYVAAKSTTISIVVRDAIYRLINEHKRAKLSDD